MGIAQRNNYNRKGGLGKRTTGSYGGAAKRASVSRNSEDTRLLHQRLRKQCFIRDNYCCTRCGVRNHPDDPSGIMLTADHIIPVARGGLFILSNYATLCYKCHAIKIGSVNKRASKALMTMGANYKRSKCV
jgi:5-methylcytosine-specific restriction endonuclease McrA